MTTIEALKQLSEWIDKEASTFAKLPHRDFENSYWEGVVAGYNQCEQKVAEMIEELEKKP